MRMERQNITEADVTEKLPHTLHASPDGSHQGLDEAYDFLQKHGGDGQLEDQQELRRIRRKIDRNIIPVMFLCYTMQFIDKLSLNVKSTPSMARNKDCGKLIFVFLRCYQYAAVMGLKEDLKLTGNDFSNTATVFFIAYLIAEVPTGRLLIFHNQFCF